MCVEEPCAGGDLLSYVRRRRRLDERVAKHVFREILEALYYCHSKRILHRDIKLDNVLLSSEGRVKVCRLPKHRSATLESVKSSPLANPTSNAAALLPTSPLRS